MDSGWLILIFVICLILSAFFSATETAYSSFSRLKMKALSEDGNKKAKKVLDFSEKFDNILSTILIGNNIVNILAATVATLLFEMWMNNSASAPTVSTIVTTLVVLIFAEITPKSLAKERPEAFCMDFYYILKFFVILFTPLNLLFGLWKKLISKIFKKKEEESITEKELITMVEEAEEDGKIDEDESELIRSAIEFDDIEAIEIFTPRVDVVAVPVETPEKEVAKIFNENGYSRLPVYKGTIDNIIGVIHQKDFYSKIYGTGKSIKSILTSPLFVTPSVKVSDLLKLFQKSKTHMAIISDEFGGTEGIITMEDILEELVGEIWDEHDDVVEDLREVSENEYIVLGTTSIDDILEKFELKDEETDSGMVGGWVIEKLGKIPNEGDTFEFEGVTITVLKTEYRRVIEVAFKKEPEKEEEN